MKTRRFFASDMNNAMHMVRNTLGQDAVILSNRKMDDGVELMVAVDYDESIFKNNNKKTNNKPAIAKKSKVAKLMQEIDNIKGDTISATPEDKKRSNTENAIKITDSRKVPHSKLLDWAQDPVLAGMQSELRALRGLLEDQLAGLVWGNTERQSPAQALVFRRLTQLGLEIEICKKISSNYANEANSDKAWQDALDELSSQIKIVDDDILKSGGVVSLLGAPGVGKTTTIAKLAARFALHYGPDHVALLTTDTYRIAAFEQLRIYGKILGITVKSINDSKNMRSILRSMRDKRLILIDTAGMGQDDLQIKEQLLALRGRQLNLKNYLVLPATSQYLVLKETIRTFSDINVAGIIVTKLDECRSLGPLLSIVLQTNLPIAYVSDGQRVPEDIHLARSQALLGNAVTIGKTYQSTDAESQFALAYSQGVVNVDT